MVCLIPLFLAGCAGFSKDGGFGNVQSTVHQFANVNMNWPRTPADERLAADRVQALLAGPLSADAAVELALINNKAMRASFYRLGLSEADVVQAGRLPNPRFSMLYARNGGDYKIEQALTFNIMTLLTMPKAQAIERTRFEATQKSVAQEVLRLARDTRIAWVEAVAANESVRYLAQVREVAEASAQLAERMRKAGNWSMLEEAREREFYIGANLEYAAAASTQIRAHERLARLLGLQEIDQDRWLLDVRLPDLPSDINPLPAAEQQAMQQRLDLQIVRMETDMLAQTLGLTKQTRLINVLELGPARVLEGGRSEPYKNGIDISFELPIFDWGDARVARAEARYMQALHSAAQQVVQARSEVREAHGIYQNSYQVAKHFRDEVVPLRKQVSQEYLLRYNGMLNSVFDLLADARQQVNGVNQYMGALRDFWIAESNLQMAMVGSIADR
jgi:outer membrane protein TolC